MPFSDPDPKKSEISLWKNLMRSPQQHSKAKTWSETSLLVFFDNSPTPLIADAMHGQNVISFLKPILPNSSIVGPAVTVKTNPNDWGTVVAAVDVASNGDVLFIDGSGSNFAVWGGLASRAAQQRGVAGTVVNASCRDVTTIEMLQYPVWARGITPRAGLPLNKGAVNVSLIVDGVTVRPRDLVKADAHGVVIIPSGEVAAVADRVLEIVQKEHAMEKGLKKGRRWSELLEDFSS